MPFLVDSIDRIYDYENANEPMLPNQYQSVSILKINHAMLTNRQQLVTTNPTQII